MTTIGHKKKTSVEGKYKEIVNNSKREKETADGYVDNMSRRPYSQNNIEFCRSEEEKGDIWIYFSREYIVSK